MSGGSIFHNPDEALVLLQWRFLVDEIHVDWILILN